MIIGGLQKFSLLDYPGHISAIVFTQGCNYRCQFCYNPMLVWPAFAKTTAAEPVQRGWPAEDAKNKVGKLIYNRALTPEKQKDHSLIAEDDLFVFLKSRLGKLDAVVITGGEPCLHKDLPKLIKKIKKLGFLVKLDTNGSQPGVLKKLLKEKLVDYLAMDLKAPSDKYLAVTGTEDDFKKISESVKIIMGSGLPYEFRTTVAPGLLDKDDIARMGKIIPGARAWYLQNFKGQTELVNCQLEGRVPYNARQMEEMAEIGRKYVEKCQVR